MGKSLATTGPTHDEPAHDEPSDPNLQVEVLPTLKAVAMLVEMQHEMVVYNPLTSPAHTGKQGKIGYYPYDSAVSNTEVRESFISCVLNDDL